MKSSMLVMLLLFLLIKLCPLAFSLLSQNQTDTMINLSKLINISSWNTSQNSSPCSWTGVTCKDSDSLITGLSLSGFGLSSSDFLPSICKIESLESIDVSNNHLSSIPDKFFNDCGGLRGLKVLNFSMNQIHSLLPDFHNFSRLETLDLSENKMYGNVSSQLERLVSLKSLNLSFNHFDGYVPVNLGKSMLLEELQLCVNKFSGQIPDGIASYRNLSFIDLSVNWLSGSIPYSIGNLTKLRILILSVNNLTGEIPSSISNIGTLYRFAANQNQFNGTIPNGITRFLSILDLSYNRLRGNIPASLFSGPNLQTVDLSSNSLEGSIPKYMSLNLTRLRLGNNSLNGTIPSSFSALKILMYLELDGNGFSDVIPNELGGCQSLALLNLAENNLTGVLPESLGSLTNLQVLKLQSNKLSGQIPLGVTRLQKLTILNFSSNSLTGSIPSLLNLPKLTHLILQQNNLNGSIPDAINTMNSLIELQLGENQLSGTIPLMPERLQIALNLSSNLFQGKIPSNLSRLNDLEVLDLSNNNFSGEIPDFLTQLESLNQLILRINQLHGVIPQFKHYVSLNVSGNVGLINITRSDTFPKSRPKKKLVTVVFLSLASAVLAVGVVMILLRLVSRHFPKVNDQLSQSWEDPPQIIQGNMLTANGIHRSNIDFTKAMEAVANSLNMVLKTRFSTYYKATMSSGASYFVKKLNWSDKVFQLGSHVKFDQELGVLGKISNSNVMTPLAYVLTADSAYLFYEYAEKGTLFDVLLGTQRNNLDWSSRYSIAVGVAHGLAFLHGCTSSPILLLDLSSRNIFLRSLKEPQIGDIELCKVIDPTKSTGSLSTVAGSIGYIPPEYAYTMRVTMPGNIYSFGVILLELLTGKPAVSEGIELAKWVQNMRQERWDHILDFNISRTSHAVRGQMLAILKVALSCVNVSPEARPKMKTVLRLILNAR